MRVLRWCAALTALLVVGMVTAGPVLAQEDPAETEETGDPATELEEEEALPPSETVGGTLRNRVCTTEGGTRECEDVFLEGVSIIATHEGGEVARAISDENGEWLVGLPEPGLYQFEIDPQTLPEGVGLRDPEQTLLEVSVMPGQHRPLVFLMGEGPGAEGFTLGRIVTSLIIGLKLGAIIALCSIGLSLVYSVTGLVNFAHAELVTIGAFAAFVLHAGGPQWPLVVVAVPAVLLVGLFGWGQEKVLWKPLRDKGMGLLTMMVVSIGFGFALRYAILTHFDGLPRAYPDLAGQEAVDLMGISVVPKHVLTVVVALLLLAAVGMFLQLTPAGTALRAVRDNPDLAESSGIDVQRVIGLTWVVGAMLAAAGGVFYGLTESLEWDMGFKLLLLMFSAVILGGVGTAYGTMLGSFIVGVSVETSVLFGIPDEVKPGVGLALLVVMLLYKPEGLLGTRERIG